MIKWQWFGPSLHFWTASLCLNLILSFKRLFKTQNRKEEIFSIIRASCDLINAIHWSQNDILWAGKLPEFFVGLFGTISSVILLKQAI